MQEAILLLSCVNVLMMLTTKQKWPMRLCNSCVPVKEAHVRQTRAQDPGENLKQKQDQERLSPWTCISATMTWDNFHMVQMIWLTTTGVEASSEAKDWKMEVDLCIWQALQWWHQSFRKFSSKPSPFSRQQATDVPAHLRNVPFVN